MIENSHIFQRMLDLRGARHVLYDRIKAVDGVLHSLSTIQPDPNGNVKTDQHTGVTMTDARREEVYEACHIQYLAAMRLLYPDYADRYAPKEDDDD